MDPEDSFSTAQKVHASALRHRGEYSRIGDTMERLVEWAQARGVEDAGSPYCLYYDNPVETPADRLRSEACIPVRREFWPEGEVLAKELPEVEVAETRHAGPPEEFSKTYGPFLEGLLSQGYRLAGPAREHYRSASEVKGPGSGYLIQQPIAKG